MSVFDPELASKGSYPAEPKGDNAWAAFQKHNANFQWLADNLKSAAFAPIQLGPLDSGAGKAQIQGAWGLGSQTPPDFPFSNLNAADSSVRMGWYRLSGTESNLPPGFSGIGGIFIDGYSSAFHRQTVFDRGDPHRTWSRVSRAGSTIFSAWIESWHSSNTIVDANGFIKEA